MPTTLHHRPAPPRSTKLDAALDGAATACILPVGAYTAFTVASVFPDIQTTFMAGYMGALGSTYVGLRFLYNRASHYKSDTRSLASYLAGGIGAAMMLPLLLTNERVEILRLEEPSIQQLKMTQKIMFSATQLPFCKDGVQARRINETGLSITAPKLCAKQFGLP